MFEELKKKWNVNALGFLVILCIFRYNGSTAAFDKKRDTTEPVNNENIALKITTSVISVFTCSTFSMIVGHPAFFSNSSQETNIGYGNANS